MKKSSKYTIILCLFVFVICIGGVLIVLKSRIPEPVYTIPRHIQYSFTLQNKTNLLVKEVEFWTYAPVKQTS